MSTLSHSIPIYCIADHLWSAIGEGTTRHRQALQNQQTGLRSHAFPFASTPICCGLVLDHVVDTSAPYTKLEQWMIHSIQQALQETSILLSDPTTLLLIATTKGNIDVLEGTAGDRFPASRAQLGELGKAVGTALHYWGTPIVVCNACISGVLALDIAKRYLRAGHYRHAVVVGGDLVTEFTLAGFQALRAMSAVPCRPFDQQRDGISLGEGVGTLVLSVEQQSTIQLMGSASANDANHISAPSRTGEGLFLALQKTLADAHISAEAIDYLCAHGTATVYNDEMEAQAFLQAKLTQVPMHSLKGYWGHTLGAAGILESIMAIQALLENSLYPSFGFETTGTSIPLAIIQRYQQRPLTTCLKTAAGFGGCNAAVVFQKKQTN